MSKTLALRDYCRAAQRLNCELAAIRAVATVESGRLGGFLPNGNVTILFERHHFSRLTRRAFDASHPQISSRSAGGYYGGENEYLRFNIAYKLNPAAAMMSASWGRFQIMGFNYAAAGFTTIHKFVDAMKHSEGAQLLAFCEFVETNNLDDELRRKDWAGFARGYNGKNYKINKYDEKMAQYYAKFRQEKVDCQKLLSENPFAGLQSSEIKFNDPAEKPSVSPNQPSDNEAATQGISETASPSTVGQGNVVMSQPDGNQTAEQITNINADTDAAKVEAAQSMPPAEIEKTKPVGFIAKVTAFFTAIFTGQYLVPQPVQDAAVTNSGAILNFIGVLLKTAYDNRYLIITVIIVWYVVKKVNNAWLTNKIATTNADPTKRDIVLVDAPKPKGLVVRVREYLFGVKD